ncbi:transposable element Tcb2 transposase [Trichonephila clavipes]|nr:transposable element Tcb2 transposase [Trichonephila clavipes]
MLYAEGYTAPSYSNKLTTFGAKSCNPALFETWGCWDQWIGGISFTQRPCSERPRQTSRREDSHIVRNACVQPIASSAAIQAQVATSLGAPVSFPTIRRRLAEGHLESLRPLRVLLLTPNPQRLRLERCRERENRTAVEWNQVVFNDEPRFNLSSDDNRVRV